MFNHKKIVEEAYSILTVDGVLLEADIFHGEVYKRKTQLSGGRLKRNIFDYRKHLTSGLGKLRPLFIIGYNLEKSHLFYEIWFLPFDAKYIIVDKFGKRTTKFKKYSTITDVIDKMVDIISTTDDSPLDLYSDADLQDAEEDLENELKDLQNRNEIRKLQRKVANMESFTEDDRVALLESNVTSRALLADMINSNIVEYHNTRMNRNKINSLWRFLLGRNIVYPSKYIGSGVKSKILSLVGLDREASFVVGYSMADKINLEVWFVKSLSQGKGNFYVFDVTSAKVVAKKLPNMRQAYAIISSKITAKV